MKGKYWVNKVMFPQNWIFTTRSVAVFILMKTEICYIENRCEPHWIVSRVTSGPSAVFCPAQHNVTRMVSFEPARLNCDTLDNLTFKLVSFYPFLVLFILQDFPKRNVAS